MTSTDNGGGNLSTPESGTIQVTVLGDDAQAEKVKKLLAQQGLTAASLSVSDIADGTLTRLPRLGAVVLDESAWHALLGARRALRGEFAAIRLPLLLILDDATDPLALGDTLDGVDAWLSARSVDTELVPRLRQILRKRTPEAAAPGLTVDATFLTMLIHDLRTPLNVMTLSARLLARAGLKGDPDAGTDLSMIEQNVKKMEAMLAVLCDYIRLSDPGTSADRVEFSPARLIREVLQARSTDAVRVILPDPSAPGRVALNESLARMAIGYALSNALTAAGDGTVRVRVEDKGQLCRIELEVRLAPPKTVKSTTLSSEFERFLSNPNERRGLDLAIVAKISELFGGSARLEAREGQASLIVLEWPSRN
jgi:signal transduction histidine kinase